MGNPRNRARKSSRKNKNTRIKEGPTEKRRKIVNEMSNDESSVIDVPRPAQAGSGTENQLTPGTYRGSSSAWKIGDLSETPGNSQQETKEPINGFVLFDFCILAEMLSSLCCPSCKLPGLRVTEESSKKQGFCICYQLQCPNCLWTKTFTTSNEAVVEGRTRNSMEVNVRIVMAFREVGIGYEGIADFASCMNMHKPMTRSNYNKIIGNMHKAYVEVASDSMKAASEELKSFEGKSDVSVSFDGSWQKPGHASLNGIVSAISVSTGKVLDYEVKSKKCKSCDAHKNMDRNSNEYQVWKVDHDLVCTTNHTGSSGKMEVDGVLDIFKRSMEKNGLRYLSFIGDGDSSTFKTVSEAKPYGSDVLVEKKECVGHVQKRMGTRLRKLKASFAKKDLSDGKKIGGKGRLTDQIVDTLQNYYGLAIRQNKNDLKGMIKDTMAGLYHVASSQENPQHQFCPEGKDSWCGWQRDKANGTTEYKSKKGLPAAIVEVVLPIFKDLSDPTLLTRCLDSHTQNPNESLNNMIWKRCPKKIFQGKKIVELCTASAVASFNDGSKSIAAVLRKLGLAVGCHTEVGLRVADRKRIAIAEKESTTKSKLQRKKLRAIRKGLWDKTKRKGRDNISVWGILMIV